MDNSLNILLPPDIFDLFNLYCDSIHIKPEDYLSQIASKAAIDFAILNEIANNSKIEGD